MSWLGPEDEPLWRLQVSNLIFSCTHFFLRTKQTTSLQTLNHSALMSAVTPAPAFLNFPTSTHSRSRASHRFLYPVLRLSTCKVTQFLGSDAWRVSSLSTLSRPSTIRNQERHR